MPPGGRQDSRRRGCRRAAAVGDAQPRTATSHLDRPGPTGIHLDAETRRFAIFRRVRQDSPRENGLLEPGEDAVEVELRDPAFRGEARPRPGQVTPSSRTESARGPELGLEAQVGDRAPQPDRPAHVAPQPLERRDHGAEQGERKRVRLQ